ncbi:MarR family transcriptional regulator [Viridibacillus arvi]|uniref:Uncharacterized protein n=1 Tax=Viridibacillus arvi TaxID=263475 RepID=A0A0M0LK63_9BACL|nr:MarR family transcriptional regulator [Viridibacillus arvi]KOO51440.1 hypothetical protein AMD00_02885 [Viridibacillus arvi]
MWGAILSEKNKWIFPFVIVVHQTKEGCFESLYDDEGDMTMKKICAKTKLSKSNLYRALDKRKNRGYL